MGKYEQVSYLDLSINGPAELFEAFSASPFKRLSGTKIFRQPEYKRILNYSRQGRLLGIVFAPGAMVDIRKLPQDANIPTDSKLVELFNAHNYTPQLQEDLIPV